MAFKLAIAVASLIFVSILFYSMNSHFEAPSLRSKDQTPQLYQQNVADLIAAVFWEKINSKELEDDILREARLGLRDRYFFPRSYIHRLNNSHFVDIGWTDESQKEVYAFARMFMSRQGRNGKVVDVGCGSGFKLVKYLSKDFDTVGIESEPALSHLRLTYPDQVWIESGKSEESGPSEDLSQVIGQCELGISADVIEHIREPDSFLEFLKSLNCRHYLISTPKREVLVRGGPPGNPHHVREWTFHEFTLYLRARGFDIIESYDGVQNFFVSQQQKST